MIERGDLVWFPRSTPVTKNPWELYMGDKSIDKFTPMLFLGVGIHRHDKDNQWACFLTHRGIRFTWRNNLDYDLSINSSIVLLKRPTKA